MSVRAPPPVWHKNQRFYVDSRLYSANYCFTRKNGKKSLFELPYKGPYKIISRNDKFFTLDLRDRVDNVSIDRLKSAYILPGYETDTAVHSDTFDSQHCAAAEFTLPLVLTLKMDLTSTLTKLNDLFSETDIAVKSGVQKFCRF